MKNIKHIFGIILFAVFGMILVSMSRQIMVIFVILLAISAMGFFIYRLVTVNRFPRNLPRIGLWYFLIFLATNIAASKHIILAAESFSSEIVRELSLKTVIFFSTLKFSGYLIFAVFLFFIVHVFRRIVETRARFCMDSMNTKLFDIDNRLQNEEITEETASRLKKEDFEEMYYWFDMKGLATFVAAVLKASFVFTLLSTIGSILILFYNKTFSPETLEKVVNYSVSESVDFSVILFVAIIGIFCCNENSNTIIKETSCENVKNSSPKPVAHIASFIDPLGIDLGSGLLSLVDKLKDGGIEDVELFKAITKMRSEYSEKGIIIPKIRIIDNISLESMQYRILVKGEEVYLREDFSKPCGTNEIVENLKKAIDENLDEIISLDTKI